MNTPVAILGALLLLTAPSSLFAQAAAFVRLDLGHGVSLELPTNWEVLSASARATLEARNEASGLNDFGTSEFPFAANLYDGSGRTLALVNARFYPDQEVTQAEAASATEAEVAALDEILHEQMEQGMRPAGMKILAWHGTTRTEFAGRTVFITECLRTRIIDGGRFRVRLVRIFDSHRSVTITVSYDDTRDASLRPITDRVISSIRTDAPVVGPDSDDRRGRQSAASRLLLAILIAGLAGAAPCLVVRYQIARSPLGKGQAIGIAASLLAISILTLDYMQVQMPEVPGMIAVFSFYMLRRGSDQDP